MKICPRNRDKLIFEVACADVGVITLIAAYLFSGQVQAAFTVIPRSLEYIRTGKLRALAVTSATRLEVLPDLPTVDEFVPGYEAGSWFGVGAPKGTSTEIIEKLK